MEKKRQNIHISKTGFIVTPRCLVAFLALFVQIVFPIAPAFAEDLVAEQPPTVAEVVSEPVPEAESLPQSDSASPPEAPLVESEDAETVNTETASVIDAIPESEILSSSSSTEESTDEASSTQFEVPESHDSDDVTEITSTSTESISSTTTPPANELIEDIVPPIVQSDIESEPSDDTSGPTTTPHEVVATTTAQVSESTSTQNQNVVYPELHTITNDDNRYSFGLNECARVADGSFYCSTEESKEVVEVSTTLFSGPDQDGDTEIFYVKKGVETQLTHNLVDDASPYYDSSSETAVWHRLVDARYQIVAYDLETGDEVVLTHDSYNNMQPTRYGDIIVWQGWVGNDWEIMMSDNNEISMLTDNTIHDIGPRINGDYIIWQAEEADGWVVMIYNTLTKEIEKISDADGASVENPRLVLVYDAKQGNGDVETRGYDLETKKSVSLDANAPNLPEELPNPDQTGEDRALISSLTQLKSKSDEDDAEPETGGGEPSLNTGTSTTTNELIIPPFGSGTSTVETVSVATGTTAIPDLVVGSTEHIIPESGISDLVVTPYENIVPTTTDSQVEVAETL